MSVTDEINLETVFTGVNLQPTHTFNTNGQGPRTNGEHHSRTASVISRGSKVSEQQKSRTMTATSHASTASSDTLRPSTPPQPAARSTVPPEPTLYVPREPQEDTSSLMEKVFAAVSLEPVKFTNRSQGYSIQQTTTTQSYAVHHEHHQEEQEVLANFDQILGSGTTPSVRSSHAGSRRSTFTQDRRTPVQVHQSYVTEAVVAEKLQQHEDHHEEERDTFDENGVPHLPGFSTHADEYRRRSQTMDSLVSTAETRYGDFDVQDDDGNFKGSTINIFHTEVAYHRPKQKTAKVPASLTPQHAVSAADEWQLRQIREEVAALKEKKQRMTQQVAREQEEVRLLQERTEQRERELRRAGADRFPLSPTYGATFINRGSRSNSASTRASVDSTTIYEEEEVKVSDVAARQLHQGTQIGVSGKTRLIVPHKHEIPNFSKNPNIHKVIIGGEQFPSDDDKTILLFGPEGSGKSAAVTSIINYLYDVKNQNDFRFVINESGHTEKVPTLTAYQINNSILPFSVTIVDTPGVKNVKGYKTVSSLIKTWFEQELVDAGKFKLDAISIVLRHDEDNLGWPFIHELAAVKKMFGDDLKTNVLPIVTHSEVLPQPIAIRSLALANVAFVEYYKVNNSGFFPPPVGGGNSRLQHNLYFSHGVASLERLFRDLQELIHPLLAILRNHNTLVNKPTLRSPTSPTH